MGLYTGGLIFGMVRVLVNWWAYTWGGLYSEGLIFGSLRYVGPTNYCPGLPETARELPGYCPVARDCPGTARELETARGLEIARGHRIQYNCPEK